MVSVTERVKTLFFSPLQAGGGGRGVCRARFPPDPHLCASHSSRLPPLRLPAPRFWRLRPQALGPKPLLHLCVGPHAPANLILAPLDFLRAVPPKNIVPVIVTSEDSASRVTSITVRSPPEAVRLRSLLGLRLGLGAGTPIGLALQVCSTLSVFHTRGPGPGTARASVNARTHLPVTTAASSRRASASQVWPVGRRTEPEAL